ncbi:prepilin-type N-terminal cleavage/methylation domain-containing protein [uncultured Selenomonas sp.]|uniref:competence type IV pilus major pilin ComGC n=1 Tax=uncultured Selenomonas sp. TaxID=159275 RepID=UPI0028D3D532|nr:prepilin-type N-terminal cleavage/methylation domain-containing protein [uncultured Selenomonas sp.]
MYRCMLLKKKMRQKESGRQGAMAGAVGARDESRCRSGRKRRRPLDEEGFTLLEMLLVICIIGVLAAVAVPKFSQSMTLANTSKIQADLSTLNTAVGLYRAEKGVDPTELKQLKEYVVNLDALKPPSGSYFLRDGKPPEKAGASYALTKGSDGETQATLDEHRVQDFGRAEKKEASGT